MARPLPTEAVIVNVSKMSFAMPENYLRNFGVVSLGETNLQKGSYKTISSSEVSDLEIDDSSYLKKWLNSFFANNTRGQVTILETGVIPGEPAASNLKVRKMKTVSSAKNYGVGDYFIKESQAYKCIKVDSAMSSSDLTPIHLTDTAYWNTTTTPKAYAIGDIYSKDGINYKCIQADNSVSATDLTPTNLANIEYWYNTALKVYNINDIYRAEPSVRKKCLKMDFGTSAEDPAPSKLAEGTYWQDDASTPRVYSIGDYFSNDTDTYECIQADNGTDANNDTPVNLSDTAYWTPLAKYEVGNTFDLNSLAYECIQADYHASIDDNTPNHIFDTLYWQPIKIYVIGEKYDKDGKNYQAIQNDKAVSLSNTEPANLLDTSYWKDITPQTVADAVKILENFIIGNQKRIYKYSCPPAFYNEPAFATLCKNYTALTSSQYFSCEMPFGKNPNNDDNFQALKGLKSFMPIYPSAVSTESVDGAITGILAGSKYDLSSSNPLSLLQWKTPSGITPNDNMELELVKALNENGCNWVSTYAANICILGGMYADGENWDYYYGLDNILYYLPTELTLMMINASNIPSQRIVYNQNGINQLKTKHEAIFNKLISFGCIDTYGQDYDFDNYTILNTGEWKTIPYAQYKAENIAKVQDGIYDGFSVYVKIAEFVLQVVDNITIE